MKKLGLLMFMLVGLLVFPGLANNAYAASAESSGTHIVLDGQELEQPAGAQAGIVRGNVMVPLRVVAEGLGYQVAWEKKSGTITITQEGTELKLTLGQDTAYVDGQLVKLSNAPFLQGDSTLVPLRFVGEQMGMKVSWDNATKSAYLTSPAGGSAAGVVPGTASQAPGSETPNSVPGGQPIAGDDDTYDPGASTGNQAVSPIALIQGISFSENRLMFAVSGSVTPNVFKMSGPERLVIDIPNADFAPTFGDVHPLDSGRNGQFAVSDYPDVSQIRYSLFSKSPSTVRIVIDLNRSVEFTVTNLDDGLVTVDLTAAAGVPNTSTGGSGRPLVVIDAGHGGSQPGAISVTKKQEKEFTLAVALKVEALLQQEAGLEVILTRTTDVTMSLQDRVKVANDRGASVFVSIHGNSIDPPSNPSGSETYYTRDESIPLANVMHRHLVKATGLADRGVRKSSLHVTRETKMPAVLLEVGYLSNKTDAELMYTEEFQQRVAEGIVAGIKEYLGL
ncbi:N-acetylmuramoyl-L-alanine amidase [Paenibacillus sp. oral taxon 786 str. D14]|uniref:N-acetylmuramoyl-L-alanine amidase family protein n=1 Tax=Paenibacillus sp. oral taxon 786 TaxID=652715 RepID=UPI0001AFD7EB|nr:N-acetylmuramoyl-L-alanine amidase family protein [Paenibacillus sp. oral taxon 786]EES72111.1 N-acetylmuramoyl-L-alanine amidase [Paenibacillus sp. oral taxon 786 str. D14]